MKFVMRIKTSRGMEFNEAYDFPVKTIKGATKHAQKMLDEFNALEKSRYGDTIPDRTLISIKFAEEGEV